LRLCRRWRQLGDRGQTKLEIGVQGSEQVEHALVEDARFSQQRC
jgi:hypothetical protein